jgi:Group II intron, maturase-specific domain
MERATLATASAQRLGVARYSRLGRPVLTGWVRYYGWFYPSKLRAELRTIDAFIVRWRAASTNGSVATNGGLEMVGVDQAAQPKPVRSLGPGTCGWMMGAG